MTQRTSTTRHAARPRTWRRWAMGCAIALLGAVLALGALLRRAPEFYEAEIARPSAEQREASDRCLANMSATASQAQRPGGWRAEFTEVELNGWLAYDLPMNHPELTKAGATAPRIDLDHGVGRIAFEYDGLVKTYISVEFDAEARDENTLAVRFRSLHGGALPLPMGLLIEPISAIAAQLGQALQWTEEEGLPVALLTLTPPDDGNSQLELRHVEITEGRIVLEGATTRWRR